jgi:serine phosphatase RsbU (regulator of sigma subunit)
VLKLGTDQYKNVALERDLIAKISEQKNKIEQQQKELEGSLSYASSIQAALLPDLRYFKKTFPESFVLFMPRDIVSGDFYWYSRKDNRIAVAAADCTGHGVPGAFMSILGISFLNEIVSKRISRANIILNRLRENVMKALHQTGENSEHKDGMDVALCVIDLDEMKMEYSGAFNPLYMIRNGRLMETRGDKMPIGINAVVEKSFTNHDIKLEMGDLIYIFSDGYPDQFGGPVEKKFRYKNLQNFLVKNCHRPLESQKRELQKNFIQWKGNLEQVDDVLIIGIKI